jgi:putative membrane-bound dehydrogenase-like protein
MSRFMILALLVFAMILGTTLAQTQVDPKAKPGEFPAPYNSGTEKFSSPPKSAAEVAATIKLPIGFKATAFAAEPDVQNPLAMAWDGKGRLWVAENYTYAEYAMRWDPKLRDRIVIFEDKKGDGHFTSRKVFVDNLEKLMSVAVGYGGVWAMCPPQLLFIPDRNGDDIPDGPAEVVLDGFKVSPTGPYHTIANGLRFGPDGWLYGRSGGTNPGEIGPPGTPANERTPLRGTIWRYHPIRKVTEVVSYGTTNPWGHDWDEHGELFFINTTNGHLWHGIAGAHFTRGTTKDPNPRVYELMDKIADHWNYKKGKGLAGGRAGPEDPYGGGHAHVGMTIYQGDNWPDEYRGHLLTLNLFGHRANQEILERKGSSYIGHRGEDMIFIQDPWFRGLEISYGPDGGVYILDWSDDGEYHEKTGVHRTSGRIYKVTYGNATPSSVGDLAKLSIEQLVALHSHRNEWFPRQARIELVTRTLNGRGVGNAKEQLRAIFDKQTDVPMRLRALWTLYSLGAVDDALLRALLRDQNEHLRVWGIRLLTDFWPIDNVMSKRPAASVAGPEVTPPAALLDEFVRLAKDDPSGLVRLVLASTLQRLPVSQRPKLAAALMGHKEDADDSSLPLLIWYGLLPIAEADPVALASLAAQCELPKTRTFIARRLAEEIDKNTVAINNLLELTLAKPEDFQINILDGMAQGLKGLRKVAKPAAWDALAKKVASSKNDALRNRIRDLSAVLGDARALDEARTVTLNPKADIESRKTALAALIAARPLDLRELCEKVLDVPSLNAVAAGGLVTIDDPAIGPALVKAYPKFETSERPQLIAALVSRPSYAKALLDAIGDKKIPRADVTAFDARQIRSFNESNLNKKLTEVWGELRDSPAEKKAMIAKWKAQLTTNVLAKADKSQGRLLFNKTCATCHTLYGEGAKIGPDLTGGGRHNLDFLLGKVFDPSASVSADFRMVVLNLKDGRVLNGIVTAKTEQTLTLKTTTDAHTVALTDIETTRESALSLMPDSMLEGLTPEQVRDLIGYLTSRSQVDLPSKSK